MELDRNTLTDLPWRWSYTGIQHFCFRLPQPQPTNWFGPQPYGGSGPWLTQWNITNYPFITNWNITIIGYDNTTYAHLPLILITHINEINMKQDNQMWSWEMVGVSTVSKCVPTNPHNHTWYGWLNTVQILVQPTHLGIHQLIHPGGGVRQEYTNWSTLEVELNRNTLTDLPWRWS